MAALFATPRRQGLLPKKLIQYNGDRGQDRELQAPVEYPAKALRLAFPIDRQPFQFCRVGFSGEGGHGKQSNRGRQCSPESAVRVIEGQGTGMEQRKEPAARLGTDQLVRSETARHR